MIYTHILSVILRTNGPKGNIDPDSQQHHSLLHSLLQLNPSFNPIFRNILKYINTYSMTLNLNATKLMVCYASLNHLYSFWYIPKSYIHISIQGSFIYLFIYLFLQKRDRKYHIVLGNEEWEITLLCVLSH
jgi:hypothetical protein